MTQHSFREHSPFLFILFSGNKTCQLIYKSRAPAASHILTCFVNLRKRSATGLKIQTLNPSARRHRLWASIHFVQADSPCSTTHSSLSLFVSGHAQHIFFFGFDSVAGAAAAVAVVDPPFTDEISGDCTATGSGTSALPIFSSSVSGAIYYGVSAKWGQKRIIIRANISINLIWSRSMSILYTAIIGSTVSSKFQQYKPVLEN